MIFKWFLKIKINNFIQIYYLIEFELRIRSVSNNNLKIIEVLYYINCYLISNVFQLILDTVYLINQRNLRYEYLKIW